MGIPPDMEERLQRLLRLDFAQNNAWLVALFSFCALIVTVVVGIFLVKALNPWLIGLVIVELLVGLAAWVRKCHIKAEIDRTAGREYR